MLGKALLDHQAITVMAGHLLVNTVYVEMCCGCVGSGETRVGMYVLNTVLGALVRGCVSLSASNQFHSGLLR